MMPENVFQLELAAALSNRRRLLMRLGLPLLLGLPFVLAAMPAAVRAGGLVMLVLFIGFFGAAVSAVRRRTEGLETRLRVLPVSTRTVRFDLILAGSLVDVLQTAPLLVLFALVNAAQSEPGALLVAAGLLVWVVLALNLLGLLLAALMRSNPEVHLAGALAVGLIAFASGLFPAFDRLRPVVAAVSAWSPVAWLAGALQRTAEGNTGYGAAAQAWAAGALGLFLLACLARGVGWPRPTRPAVDSTVDEA